VLFSKEELEMEIRRWHNRLVKVCTICNGVGTIDKPNSNKAIMCECQQKSLTNSHLVASGVPRKYLDGNWNWDTLNNNKESTKKVKKFVENFQQNYCSGRWLYIYGRQGRGKSLLESLSARDIITKLNPDTNRHFKVAFIIFEEMIQLSHEARSDSAAKKKYYSIIESTDLLIIDNIGSETGTVPYNSKILEYILRKRDNNCVPTIISSNFTLEQIKEHYSDTIHDFIIQNSDIVLVEGENFRQKGTVVADDFDEDFF
jgi:DNA replication protein DnaC